MSPSATSRSMRKRARLTRVPSSRGALSHATGGGFGCGGTAAGGGDAGACGRRGPQGPHGSALRRAARPPGGAQRAARSGRGRGPPLRRRRHASASSGLTAPLWGGAWAVPPPGCYALHSPTTPAPAVAASPASPAFTPNATVAPAPGCCSSEALSVYARSNPVVETPVSSPIPIDALATCGLWVERHPHDQIERCSHAFEAPGAQDASMRFLLEAILASLWFFVRPNSRASGSRFTRTLGVDTLT
jgi:hypothetical protein